MFLPDRAMARALLAFRTVHGRRWKAKLLLLWSTGRDVEQPDGAVLRALRNQGGPAWLCRLTTPRWRTIARLAAPGDPALAALSLTRAQDFHQSARLGMWIAQGPALHLLAIACELGLKAFLLAHGWSDDECRKEIRHDLGRALKEARQLGLAVPRHALDDIVMILGPAYASHRIDALVARGLSFDLDAALDSVAALLNAVSIAIGTDVPGDAHGPASFA